MVLRLASPCCLKNAWNFHFQARTVSFLFLDFWVVCLCFFAEICESWPSKSFCISSLLCLRILTFHNFYNLSGKILDKCIHYFMSLLQLSDVAWTCDWRRHSQHSNHHRMHVGLCCGRNLNLGLKDSYKNKIDILPMYRYLFIWSIWKKLGTGQLLLKQFGVGVRCPQISTNK